MKRETKKARKERIDRMARMDAMTKELCALANETGYDQLKTIAYDIRVWNDSINRRWR